MYDIKYVGNDDEGDVTHDHCSLDYYIIDVILLSNKVLLDINKCFKDFTT